MPTQFPRLAKLLGVHVHEVAAQNVMRLIADKIPEDTDLDYKQANEYIKDNEGAEELAKDVTGLANARGGLLIIGIEEDSQACAANVTPVDLNDTIRRQIEQRLRARVVPWIHDVDIRLAQLDNAPGTGFILIGVPRSPLAPHAVLIAGGSKPRFAYALRTGTTTAWLGETEIADAYRNRFRLAEEHVARARRMFDENPVPERSLIDADAVWIEVAIVPSGPAECRLDMTFIRDVQQFLSDVATSSPAPHLARTQKLAIARRRVHMSTPPAGFPRPTHRRFSLRARPRCLAVPCRVRPRPRNVH